MVGSGDWHIGSQYTDYEMWYEHMSMIRETPGVFMVAVGDERDNFVLPKYTAGLFEGVANPDQQAEFVRIWLKRLDDEGKILARAGGNHDHFTWLQSGIDLEGLWYREMKSPLFRNGGFLHLQLNGINYDGFLHHGGSLFNSNFNPNHASRRAFEFMGPYDFSFVGHKHVAETAHSYRWTDQYQKDVVMVRTGTYKTEDQYARAKQLGRGHKGGTTLVLCTVEKRMIPFLKIEDAIDVMEALNKQ